MQTDKKLNLVLEGGGVKGIGLVGAIAAFEKKGYRWKRLAGTSAGAIIATLLAVGYTGEQLKQELLNENFSNMMDHPKSKQNFMEVVGTKYPPLLAFKIGQIYQLWTRLKGNKGLFPGDYVENYVRELIGRKKKGKKNYTFGDLEADHPGLKPKLSLMVTDISAKKLLILPKNARDIGLDPQKLELASAMRMSMSFPFFFTPKIFTHEDKEHWLVDGGVLSNFPAWLISKLERGPNKAPTIGLLLDEQEDTLIEDAVGMFKALLGTLLAPLDQAYLSRKADKNQHIIKIPVGNIGTLDFELSETKKLFLYSSGRDAARTFIEQLEREGVQEDIAAATLQY